MSGSRRVSFTPARLRLLRRMLRDQGVEVPVPARSTPDLAGEARLDPTIVPGPGRRPAEPPRRQVLLTGATGFLGVFLLAELLRGEPDASVTCLVRAADPATGAQRIERGLRSFQLWDEAYRGRVEVVCGDLTRPRLGLADTDFEDLAGRVGLIIHNGATVHVAHSYQQLRAANVLGTREVLRLAARRGTPTHFVSTSGVLLSRSGNPDLLREDHRVPPQRVAPNGYLQTKWVGEELVREAGRRGLPTAIHRPSRISGVAETGVAGTGDAFWIFVRACLELGAAPDGDGWQARQNLVPVDHVARALIWLARHRPADGSTYHLVNPEPVDTEVIAARLRAAGYRLASLPAGRWADLLATTARTAPAGSGLTVVAELVRDLPAVRAFSSIRSSFDRTNAVRGLAGSGITCPRVTPEVLDRYVRFFTDAGFLPRPRTAVAG